MKISALFALIFSCIYFIIPHIFPEIILSAAQDVCSGCIAISGGTAFLLYLDIYHNFVTQK